MVLLITGLLSALYAIVIGSMSGLGGKFLEREFEWEQPSPESKIIGSPSVISDATDDILIKYVEVEIHNKD